MFGWILWFRFFFICLGDAAASAAAMITIATIANAMNRQHMDMDIFAGDMLSVACIFVCTICCCCSQLLHFILF